jgi:microcystin-dependent protein
MFIDDVDDGSNNIETFLRTIDDSTSTIKGHVRVSNRLNAADFALFTITDTNVEATGYHKVTVSYVSGSTSFSNSEDIIVTFARTGTKGDTGSQGNQGVQGATGPQGNQGVQGAQGDDGANSSVAGPQGAQGVQGSQGVQGATGPQGNQGVQGATGPQGNQGVQGATGPQGNQGRQGAQGNQGVQGSQGGLSTYAVPSGGIILWSGASNAIPSGWVLCNGSNSTPDLRNRFVVGAGDSYAVDATGGAASVTLSTDQLPAHSHSTPNHSHSFSATTSSNTHNHTWDRQDAQNDQGYRPWPASNNDCVRTTANTGDNTHSHSVSGTTGNANPSTNNTGSGNSHENRPPYYALCYIMKT